MAGVSPVADSVPTVDGVPLKIKLRRAERMRTVKAVGLIMPLFVFLAVTFVIPIIAMLVRSVENPEMGQVLPRLSAEMQVWDGQGRPPPRVLAAFATEVVAAKQDRTIGKVAKRLNYHIPGYRSLLFKTSRKLDETAAAEGLEAVANDAALYERLVQMDKRWGDHDYWGALRNAAPPYTAYFLLKAVDKDLDAEGEVINTPEDNAIYLGVLWRTVEISFFVTVICLILGYPIAFLLATVPTKASNALILLLLLPFWTSLLVRTTAWLVLLQNEGLVNDLGIVLGAWAEPLELVRNRLGVYIAMVHILLPFMVLPIFSVMKGIDPYHMKAAASLGANALRSFIKVYLPQTVPGVGAGVLLVFILSLGYYITPALVGGPKDQMLSYFIALHANQTVNWGLASALSVVLMICVAIFFTMYQRLVGVGNIKMN